LAICIDRADSEEGDTMGKLLLSGFSAMLLAVCLTSTAKAVEGPYYARFGWGCWGDFPVPVYTPERVPYYNLYPPVNYERPAPLVLERPVTYQISPTLACPPMATTAVQPSTPPLRIINPYVSQAASE
jgi:hypothetical protein